MKVPRCSQCQRAKRFFEGCSHVTCPERKPVTAAPQGAVQNLNPSTFRRFVPKEEK